MKTVCDFCGREFDDQEDGLSFDFKGRSYHMCCDCLEGREDIVVCEECHEWRCIYDIEVIEETGKHICSSCRKAGEYYKCAECGTWHVGKGHEAQALGDDGTLAERYNSATGMYEPRIVELCDDCYVEKAFSCAGCGETYYPKANAFEWDADHLYCGDCRSQSFYHCERCGEWTDTNTGVTVTMEDGTEQTWCENCADEYSRRCGGCLTRFEDEALSYCADDRCYYCHDCYPSESDEEDEGNGILDWDAKPSPEYWRSCEEDEGEPYLGFEIEAGGASCQGMNAAKDEIFGAYGRDHVYLKHDGSIPDWGFEMVSQPMTLSYHENLAEWKPMLQICREHGMKSHDFSEKACGLHVHVTRHCLDEAMWRVVDAFVNLNQEDFEKIGRRKSQSYYEYMSGYPGFGKYHNDRYRAVNFTNCDTIEFRFPNGSLIHNTVLATLELAHSLWKAGRLLEGERLLVPIEGSEWRDYDYVAGEFKRTWVKLVKEDGRYARLLEYIKNKGAFGAEFMGEDNTIEFPEQSETAAE